MPPILLLPPIALRNASCVSAETFMSMNMPSSFDVYW